MDTMATASSRAGSFVEGSGAILKVPGLMSSRVWSCGCSQCQPDRHPTLCLPIRAQLLQHTWGCLLCAVLELAAFLGVSEQEGFWFEGVARFKWMCQAGVPAGVPATQSILSYQGVCGAQGREVTEGHSQCLAQALQWQRSR